jgi:DNA-binding response OmpR family regulator
MTNPRFLLVDDDPDLGVVVRILTRRCGHDLTHRLDAESAWAGLDADSPDLILLDVNLPGTSGLEFLRRLRASPDHARRAVGLFVQPALKGDIAAGWIAGADYLVSKDLVTQPDAWKSRLDEILEHQRGRDSGTSLFIKDVVLPEADAVSPPAPTRFPPFDGMSTKLLQAMKERAGATASLTPGELRPCLLRIIDQVGCLFGGVAVERMLEFFHAERVPSEKSPSP